MLFRSEDEELSLGIASLLGHFRATSDITEQSNYQSGSLQDYDAVFYVGGTHKSINSDFLTDAYESGKPVVWMGRGLNWLGSAHPLSRFGLEYVRLDSSNLLDTVGYKDTALAKTNPFTSIIRVTDASKAEVLAWVSGEGGTEPYAVRSGNHWFFADIPLLGANAEETYSVSSANDSAYLVLADLLHDILDTQHDPEHPALLRIEDIHPKTDVDRLNKVVDFLYNNNIPFGIGLVPVYVNPKTGEDVHLADRPEFVEAIKNAQAKGAIIVLHGYTHQRVGESVVDYEFWDGKTHAPPEDETYENTRARVEAALQIGRAHV